MLRSVGRIDVYHHIEGDPRLDELRVVLDQFRSAIMTTQAELAQQILAVRDQLQKVHTEVTGKIAELEAAVLAAGNVSPEVEAALQAVRSALQPIDDLIPDAPTP
jgi:hypothetical protein